MDAEKLRELVELSIDTGERQLTDEETARLEAILLADPEARHIFIRFRRLQSLLNCEAGSLLSSLDRAESETDINWDVVLEHAAQEKQAGIRREAEVSLQRQLEAEEESRRQASWARMMGLGDQQRVEVHKRFVIPAPMFYGGIAAAIVFVLMIGYAIFRPLPKMNDNPAPIAEVPPERSVVATLNRTLDAVWAERSVEVRKGEGHSAVPLRSGAELREGDSYTLLRGFAQLENQYGAIMKIQAPCEIELLGENRVRLSQGLLVGRCPTVESKGFTVDTPTARIVDLGTEFGVLVGEGEDGGDIVEAYVYEGSIRIGRNHADSSTRQALVLKKHEAAVATQSDLVKAEQPQRIALNLSTAAARVSYLDVVDIVAGGDGTGERASAGIHPETGAWVSQPLDPAGGPIWEMHAQHGFQPVNANPLVDGVFVVPLGGGSTAIDSLGTLLPDHVTSDSAASRSDSFGVIWTSGNGHIPTDDASARKMDNTFATLGLAELDRRMLILHAGAGLTLDLQQIRARLSDQQTLDRFTVTATNAGAVRRLNDQNRNLAEVHVIVDGEKRFSQLITGDQPRLMNIDVALRSEDRMMSILVTSGGDGINYDWILLGQPRIGLEM